MINDEFDQDLINPSQLKGVIDKNNQNRSFTNISPKALSTLNDINTNLVNQGKILLIKKLIDMNISGEANKNENLKLQPIFKNPRIFSPYSQYNTNLNNNGSQFNTRRLMMKSLQPRQLEIQENNNQMYENQKQLLKKQKLEKTSSQLKKLNIIQRKRRLHSQYLNETFNFSTNITGGVVIFSPKEIITQQKPQLTTLSNNNSYSRTLMSQRFSNQNIINKINEKVSMTRFSNTLNMRSYDTKFNNTEIQAQMASNRELNKQPSLKRKATSIIIQDDGQKQKVDPELAQVLKIKSPQNNQSILSNLLTNNNGNENKDLNFELDDQCIKNNAFNVVIKSPSILSGENINQQYYQVLSPREYNRTQYYKNGDEINSNSRLLNQGERLKNRRESQQSQLDNSEFHKGIFKEFQSIKEYFHKFEAVKQKFDVQDMNSLRNINSLEFFILHRLFPRIYSVKIENKQFQEIDFNPSVMSQLEIFLVKSEVYMHTEKWDKAQFFMQQGLKVWGEDHSFEFSYNQGLLCYLTGDFNKSIEIYANLFGKIVNNQDEKHRLNGVLFNYIMCLLRVGRYDQVLDICKQCKLKKVRMTLDPGEIQIQKLIMFAEQHINRGIARDIIKELDSMQSSSKHCVQSAQTLNEMKSEDNQFETNKQDNNQDQGQDFRKINFQRFHKHSRAKSKGRSSSLKKNLNFTQQIVKSKTRNQTINIENTEDQAKLNKSNIESKVINKARFDIHKINDTTSPNYIMSMKEIINKLQIKGGIEHNKHLQYQLKNLDSLLSENSNAKKRQNKNGKGKDRDIIAFPFQKSPNMATNPYNEEEEDLNKFNLADQCLRNLEELELDLAMSNGANNMKKHDPILQHYKTLCHSIYNLCQEEGLFQILQQAADERKNKKLSIKRKALYPGAKTDEIKKYSVAKDILVSSLLKKKKGYISLSAQNNQQLVEIEVLQSKVLQLKEVLKEEIDDILGKNKSMEYIDQAANEINKMLAIARKKQKEREKYQSQDFDDNLTPIKVPGQLEIIKEPTLEELLKTKTLQYILKKQKYQEEIARRFKVDRQKYMLSLVKSHSNNQEERETTSSAQTMMRNYTQTQRGEIDAFVSKSTNFLEHLFDNYGAYFIAQKTYCMSEFLELAPLEMKQYFDNVSSVLSTIPMRFDILTDSNIDDSHYQSLENSEFIYNRYDLIYRFVSQSLRQQRYVDYLGLEKHDWIIEVIQKFNMITILNFIMRESLGLYQQKPKINQKQNQDGMQTIESQTFNKVTFKSVFNDQSLQILREQFAKLKHQNYINLELVDKFLGTKIEFFSQFIKIIRTQLYILCSYKTIKNQTEVEFNQLSHEQIIVLLNGVLIVQIKRTDESQWENYQYLNPGTTIPIQFLYYMRLKNSGIRLFIEKSLRLSQDQEDIEYLEINKQQLSQVVFGSIKNTLIKKIQLMQNVDLLGGVTGQVEKNELVSPYSIFVLASVCKVQIFKFSEVICRQNELPKGMYIFLEGQGKAVFEDMLQRKGDVSQFFRKSMRSNIPQTLRFGNQDFRQKNEQDKNLKISPIEDPLSNNQRHENQNFVNQDNLNLSNNNQSQYLTPDYSMKFSPIKQDYLNVRHKSPATGKDFSITFQNLVLNEKWTEHQKTNQISYKHHIVFEKLQEGSYFGSRIVLDEAVAKNFIKNNQSQLRKWCQLPNQRQMQAATSRRSYDNFDEGEANESKIDQFSDDSGIFSSKMYQSKDMRQQNYYEKLDDNDYIIMKNYLLRSQLTIVATSSLVKIIIIQRGDKSYFNETTKKIIEERIQEKEYLDVDRPIKKLKDLEKIREKEKDWDKYKRNYEEQCIQDSFHKRFDKQLFK
ncbi:UNKNOWN [Stylonychia lemnae]|uniref:Tpr domain containing protein n=1 Tax=Stylonychia lemnae TaxID=5949 RepID=A0A078B631_STYLE|nr:UNKNOWN [Stylonychia lemnae]|eukprot:CDW89869.1 UNKNOWN [Stylonychia lemnae]